MRYQFPRIEHINDVLPAIEGREEFIVAEREWGKVINYMVNLADTFPPVATSGGSARMREEQSRLKALRRECRGLLFYPNGKIMATTDVTATRASGARVAARPAPAHRSTRPTAAYTMPPRASRRAATAGWPRARASRSGVPPELVVRGLMFMVGFASSAETTAAWPCCDAMCRGVQPFVLAALTATFGAARSAATTAT